jgi:hypothetical protein
VFLTWALVNGDRWALPVAAFVASFVTQTHVGYAPLAVPLLALGAAGLVVAAVRGGRGDDGPSPRRLLAPGLAALGVLAVMWLPPVVQQLTDEPGNLSAVVTWFRSGGHDGEPARGLRAGWRIVTGQYGWPPEWIAGERGVGILTEPVELHFPVAPVLLAVIAAAAVVVVRRRVAPGAGSLLGVWLVATVAGVVAVARTIGPIYDYRTGWTSVLAMVAAVACAWVGWSAAVAWRPALQRRVLVPASLALVAVLAVVGAVAHGTADAPQPRAEARLRAVVPDVIDGLPAGDGRVVVAGRGGFESLAYAPSLVLQLERRGVDARMPPGNEASGEHRDGDGDGPPRARLVVATGDEIAAVAADRHASLLAYAGAAPLDEMLEGPEAGRPPPAAGESLAVFLVAGT